MPRFAIERLLLKLGLNFSLRIQVVVHFCVQFSGKSGGRPDFLTTEECAVKRGQSSLLTPRTRRSCNYLVGVESAVSADKLGKTSLGQPTLHEEKGLVLVFFATLTLPDGKRAFRGDG